MTNDRILIAHHEAAVANRVCAALRRVGYTVSLAFTSDEAIRSSKNAQPALLIIDPIMRGLSGFEAAAYMVQQINCRVIFLTDLAGDKDFEELLNGQFGAGPRSTALPTTISDKDLIAFVGTELGTTVIVPDSDREESQRESTGPTATERAQRTEEESQVPRARSVGTRNVQTYTPLFSISNSNLYQTNAFRLTGLRVTATAREVRRTYQEFSVSKDLKRSWTPDPFVPYITFPSSEEREAAFQQINQPEQRLLQEFFWFWFDREGDQATADQNRGMDQCVQAWRVHAGSNDSKGIAEHNLAVFNHLMALQTESVQLLGRPVIASDFWKEAFRHWKSVFNNSRFWDGFIERIRVQNDPRVSPDMAERLWTSLPEGLLYINAVSAVKAAEGGDFAEAARQRQLMYSSGFDSTEADKALNRAIKPLLENLSLICSQARSQVEASPRHGLEIVRAFDVSKSPLLKTLNCLVGANDARRDAAHDEVATTIRSCLIDYVNETRDWSAALPVFENCLALAQTASLRSTIAEDIVILHGNLAAQSAERSHASQSASSGASKSAIPGHHQPQRGAGLAQRLGFGIGRAWREMPALGRAIFVILLLGLVVVLRVMSSGSASTSVPSSPIESSPNSSSSTTSGSESLPQITPSAPISSEPSDSPSTFTPITSTPTSSNESELGPMKADIEASQSRLADLEAQLKSINSELDEYRERIDSDKAALTQMESDSSSGLEVDKDEYEQIRHRHNQNVDRFNEDVERHNELLRTYRALLAETNDKIDRYNSMVKSQ